MRSHQPGEASALRRLSSPNACPQGRSKSLKKTRRHRITDLTGNLGCIALESVAERECLQERGLAKRDRAMITGMRESAPSDVRASGGKGGCHVIPTHSSVNIGILVSAHSTMTLQLEFARERRSTSSVNRDRLEAPESDFLM